MRFKLSDDAPVFCDHGDDHCNYSDDDSACNANGHDNNHADGALVVSVDGARRDAEATEAGAAD
ncbi:MAG TPA: hypothetical protein VFI33_14245 [Puia sp.]|nr:hypothetical protein [Puia sp.]